MDNKIYVIGIGEDGANGLTAQSLQRIRDADLLLGGERHLACFQDVQGERKVLESGLAALVEELKDRRARERIVVLASGDPLFFGMAGYLAGKLEPGSLEIIPQLSSMQRAFAKLGTSWQDAVVDSVHGRPMTGLAQRIDGQAKVALLTDEVNSPMALAAYLLRFDMTEYDAFVGENLGGPEERYHRYSLAEMATAECSPLNVVILLRRIDAAAPRRGFGFADEQFQQRKPEKGLITKREVRVFSLSELCLSERSVVWDIGAGSGSVAVECARLAKYGKVFAIEKNEGDLANIVANQHKFRTDFPVIHAKAPDGLENLPAPDAVFIGGSGGELEGLISLCAARLRPDGRIVVNAVTVETLHASMSALQAAGLETSVTLVQTARSKPILGMTRLEGLNPVYVITGRPRCAEDGQAAREGDR